MHALDQSFRVLVDPVDGVPVALRSRRWLAPLLALVLAVGFSTAAFALRWDAAPGVLRDLDAAGKLGNMPNAEVAESILTAQRLKLISGLAFALFVVPVEVLAGAGFLKFVLWLLGKRARYAAVFTALALALLPIALSHLVLGACEAWQASLTAAQVPRLVPSHLGALVHPASLKLGRVLSAVDFFALWSAALLGLGLADVTGMARVRGVVLGLVLYVAYAAVFILGLPGLMGGNS